MAMSKIRSYSDDRSFSYDGKSKFSWNCCETRKETVPNNWRLLDWTGWHKYVVQLMIIFACDGIRVLGSPCVACNHAAEKSGHLPEKVVPTYIFSQHLLLLLFIIPITIFPAFFRGGLDVNSFNFIFVQKASRVELRNLSYANLDGVDISISSMHEDVDGWSAYVTNTTSVQHTWSKTFEHSVDAPNLTLKGNLAVLSCEAGRWKVNVDRTRHVLWEGIGDAKEEQLRLHPVELEEVNYKFVVDEASCAVPFNATLCITTEDGGVVSFRVKGELKLVAFGNFVPAFPITRKALHESR